jgi:hypothetical protein
MCDFGVFFSQYFAFGWPAWRQRKTPRSKTRRRKTPSQ